MFRATQVVVLAACCAAAPAVASVTVFDSRAAFRAWGEMMPQVRVARENFSAVSQGFTPGALAGMPASETSWQASSIGGLSGAGGMLHTLEAGRSMVIDFQSSQVRDVPHIRPAYRQQQFHHRYKQWRDPLMESMESDLN